jgi:hypothetical protein
MFENFEKYNKFWGALIPVVVWALNEYFGAGVTVEGVEQWSNDLILLLSPVFAFWMTNKESK